MAASNLEEGAEPPLPSVGGRLREARWLLGIIAVVLVVLFAVEEISREPVRCAFRSSLPERWRSRHARAPPSGWRAGASPPSRSGRRPASSISRKPCPTPASCSTGAGVVRYANDRALVAFPIRTGEALTFRLRAPGPRRGIRPGRQGRPGGAGRVRRARPDRALVCRLVRPPRRLGRPQPFHRAHPRRPVGTAAHRPHPRRFRRQCQP